jgi:ABC-type branched-subunit amino acid transport system substrate-binding protein
VQAFDATTVLIRAVGRAIDDAGGGVPTRRQVLNQVAQTRDLSGLMGRTSFDTRGDTTLRLVSAYRWTAPLARSGDFVTQVTIP